MELFGDRDPKVGEIDLILRQIAYLRGTRATRRQRRGCYVRDRYHLSRQEALGVSY